MELVLEQNAETVEDKSVVAPGLMLTPPVGDEAYWLYRVKLSNKQAIVAFPKFGCIGVGFKAEEDWNTNLPAREGEEGARIIFEHIKHNKGDDSIPDDDCIRAIGMIQDVVNV